MSYRKINVDGKAYRYSIGRTHVKIIGDGYCKIVAKSEVGQPIAREHVVTPYNIRMIIQGYRGPRVFRCVKHGTETTELAYDPFAWEIEGLGQLMMACDDCIEDISLEI